MRIFGLLLTLIILLASCSGSSPGKQIIGKWEFVKFYSGEELTKDVQEELDEHNATNKELTIRFSPSGQYESDQPGGPRENNLIADYKVLAGNRLVIENDTIIIIEVDDQYLSLARKDHWAKVMFRRKNFTGTEPGRR